MGVAENNAPTFETGEKDELLTQFDTSIKVVQNHTSQFEKEYARPVLNRCYAYSRKRPISAVFLAFFGALSFLPVLTFLGLSLFTTAAFTTVALGAAFVAAAGVVLLFLAVLCSVLIATFFASLFLAIATIFTYFFLRLAILVKREGIYGAASWLNETKQTVLGAKIQYQQQKPIKGGQNDMATVHIPVTEAEDSKSDTTTELGAISPDVFDKPVKIEGRFEGYNDYGVKTQGE